MAELHSYYGWISIGLVVSATLLCVMDRHCAKWDRVLCTAMAALMTCWMTTGMSASLRYGAAALLAAACLGSALRTVQARDASAPDLLLSSHRVSGALLMAALLFGLGATQRLGSAPSHHQMEPAAGMGVAMSLPAATPPPDFMTIGVALTYGAVGGATVVAMLALRRRGRGLEAAAMTAGMTLMLFAGHG